MEKVSENIKQFVGVGGIKNVLLMNNLVWTHILTAVSD